MDGAVYVAYGPRARAEAQESIKSLILCNDLPITAICNDEIPGVDCVHFDRPGPGARWAKLNLDRLVDYDNVAYLDADTRVNGDLSPAFAILADGWDMAIALSTNQGGAALCHIGAEEKRITLKDLGNPLPLQLQAGVIFFNRRRCTRLFAAWRDEWLRWKDKDQAALLRALQREPVRIWLLGRDWNGGAIIEHLFGRAR